VVALANPQCTLKGSRRYSGIALHTGVRAHITLQPAPANAGIQIVRSDLIGQPAGAAIASNVVDCTRATTLAIGDSVVHTVEHVLAALYASGVDNAVLMMDGPEPPIADGSSDPYLALISEVGVEVQDAERRSYVIDKPLYVEQGDSRLVVVPDDDYRISCTVKYGDSLLNTQYRSLPVTQESFRDEMSRARTFCLYHEIESLMVAGLIRGGSLDNAVVAKGDVIISKDGLRYSDEFVRHKMLDIVGDLSLVGRRLQGHVIAVKPGHQINVTMAQTILEHFAAGDDHLKGLE
jgi:UDP-3-O-[3-hydroxymyristoyl] N-acetylglucosamine deacetylase/3-hydroxyacyl-[acyl-carrier-protein] dehydratase